MHPAVFDFTINLVTAKTLGLTAAHAATRADEVIEERRNVRYWHKADME